MKKIMFNDRYGLTDAVIQGRKPKTRRICKEYATQLPILSSDVESFRFYPDENIVEFLMLDGSTKVSVPPYKINEVVAVAQSYENVHDYYFDNEDDDEHVIELLDYYLTPGWSNKMFVRPDLMPHQIRFTDNKVERLQDISAEDVYREGFRHEFVNNGWGNAAYHEEAILVYYDDKGRTKQIRDKDPKEAFSFLIDKVSGNGTWESNPFVYTYTFELVN